MNDAFVRKDRTVIEMFEPQQIKKPPTDLRALTLRLGIECSVAKKTAAHTMALHREGLELQARIELIHARDPAQLNSALLSCREFQRTTGDYLIKLSDAMTMIAHLAIAKDLSLPKEARRLCEDVITAAKSEKVGTSSNELIDRRFLKQSTIRLMDRITEVIITATNDLARHCEQLEQFHRETAQLLKGYEQAQSDPC